MKQIVISAVLLAMAFSATAQKLTPEEVRHNAQQFADGIVAKRPATIKEVSMPTMGSIAVYNIEGGGFVVASNDSRTLPILAYSQKGNIDADNLPEGVRYWLGEYESQIAQLGNTTLEELQALTGLSSGGIRKAIRRLKDAQLLHRVGPDKGGHWEVLQQ